MGRKPTEVNQHQYQLLKHLVKAKSKLKCDRVSEVQQLRYMMKKKNGDSLSLQTLSRVFGIITDGFNPSIQTLDALSKYVDYSSFEELGRFNPDGDASEIHSSHLSKFIVTLLSDIKSDANVEPGIILIVKKVVDQVLQDSKLASEIYYGTATNCFGRKYFFEHFVNMDGLGNIYGEGLKYYLLNAQFSSEKFFAYIMYCYRYFLQCNDEMFKVYFNQLNQFNPSDINVFHPILIDRFYAVQVLNQYIDQKNASQDMSSLEGMIDFDMLLTHHESCYCAGYLVGEALVLTGEFEKAWEVLNSDSVKLTSFPVYLQSDFYLQLNVLKLISGLFSGRIVYSQAVIHYKELVDKPLSVLVNDFYSFFLLVIKKRLFEKNDGVKIDDQKKMSLINKTGFSFFKDYCDDI
jgi:hypothetical protein